MLGGLTDFGRAVVAEMNRIGMMVDLSHVAPTTMRDALDVATAPVMFTPLLGATPCADHPRNVPDDVLATLAGNGGVCMVTFVPRFVSQRGRDWSARSTDATRRSGRGPRDLAARDRVRRGLGRAARPAGPLDDVVAHLEHVREVAGIEHIGIGGDFDGTTELPHGLDNVAGYPRLFDALLARSWSVADCERLAQRNVLRVLREVDEASAPAT